MERRNKNAKSKGNGEGTIYFSETLRKWVAQYTEPSGKRKTLTQKKYEKVSDFKKRFNSIISSINNDTYIAKSNKTIIDLLNQHIEQKHDDKIISDRSYRRELETIEQIKKTCSNFCYLPIQKVTIEHIEFAKQNIKKYSNSVISKIWGLLKKGFQIASSPSRKILTYNIMLDVDLRKPISVNKNEKVKALTIQERNKLISILDNEEKNHPYRNIVKMQYISGMRIGEVLARSIADYDKEKHQFNIHNTLTQDTDYHIIVGNHTKTYDKSNQLDLGQRYLPLDTPMFSDLIEIIEEQIDSKVTNMYGLLFWDYKKNTFITPTEVNSWLHRINEKYNIATKLTTHRLRHTAITYWKQNGIPLEVVQYLAGHIEGSTITSNVYIDVSPEYVLCALKK